MKKIKFLFTVLAVSGTVNLVSAHGDNPHLHVNPRWKECSFQLDPSLTQDQWHQFAHEGGLVTYFRPIIDAKPMGAGRIELSVLQWNTGIDEGDDAWNNTFVHPDSSHWLVGGDELPFPGLTLRGGITRRIDAAIYWSERPGANYGIAGAQVQYNIFDDTTKNWSASARLGFNHLYGPEDLNLNVYGTDFIASKKFKVYSNWAAVSPYVGLSAFVSRAHEKTEAVNLKDENVLGGQGMVGAVAQLSVVRIGAEYNFAKVNSFSYKLGISIKF